MSNWIEIKAVLKAAPDDWSPFIEAFDNFGCPGTLQADEPPSLSAYMAEVEGASMRVDALSCRLLELGAMRVDTKIVPEEDWSQTWREFFKPRRIGKSILITPSWERTTAMGGHPEVEIVLDPGQAFGTGDHPTTRLCLQLLERVEPKGKTVADIGCGSGILAIAAVKLGASRVFASDLDEQSVEITRENAELNQVTFDTKVGAGFDVLDTSFDIVLSNIISATLIRLAPDAARAVAAGGRWIVSGIIEQNWADVLASAISSGFELVELEREDEWVGAIFRR